MTDTIDNLQRFKLVLGDNNPRVVAVALSKQYLAQLKEIPEYANVIEPLQQARDLVWPDTLGNKETFADEIIERKNDAQKILAQIKNDEDRLHFIEAFGKIGHLYDAAGQIARDNFFAKQRENKPPIRHGAEEYISSERFETPEDAIRQLNKVKFEATFTSHPTNNNSLEVMEAIRTLGEAASDLRKEGNDEERKASFNEAMENFAKAKLVPERNYTASGETQQMLNAAENVYNDLPATYRYFDRALEAKAQKSGCAYHPLDLHLGIKINSWGSSGDKDGNKKISSDTTLQAAYMHTAKMAELLQRDLSGILKSETIFDYSGNSELDQLARDMQTKKEKLDAVSAAIETYAATKQCISAEKFEDWSKKLSELAPDARMLEKAAIQAYGNVSLQHSAQDEHIKKQKLLTLIRHVRMFGPHVGKIEYRETSEEFTKIVGMAVDEYLKTKTGYKASGHYDKMGEDEKIALLTTMLQNGDAPKVLSAVQSEISKGFGHNFDQDPYPDKNPAAIAYHTLKRLELARDNPDLVANHVLAECQGLSNKLELQLLMEGVSKNGKKLTLGIIPLYEDPAILGKVKGIEAASYSNEAYKRHLQEFTQAHPDECACQADGTVKLTQQVQFAHSDNRRRGGPAAAVGYIDQAHRDFRAAAEAAGIEPRSYEGGSLSDAFRNGVRSMSAMITEFGLYKFTKSTFQGGDLLNYFGHPHSCERLLTRSITHCAKHYDAAMPVTDLKKAPYEYLAVQALKKTMQDYESNVFKADKIGLVIANSGFGKEEMNAGSVGTRGPRDPNKVFVIVDVPVLQPSISTREGKTRLGFAKSKVSMLAADPNNIRTISFSELLEHAGVYPTWLGTRTIAKNITAAALDMIAQTHNQEFLSKADELAIKDVTTMRQHLYESPGRASPKFLKELYNRAPTFKEVIDRMAFGISMSSLDNLEQLNLGLKDTQLMKDLKKEYMQAGNLVLAAMGSKHRTLKESVSLSGATEVAAMRQAVTTALSNLEPTINHKRNYMDFVNQFKRDWLDKHPGKEAPMDLLRATHCAMDTALLGRWVPAEDTRYMESLNERKMGGKGYAVAQELARRQISSEASHSIH